MAQLAEKRHKVDERVRLLLRQRPSMAVGVTLLLGLMVGAVGCGIFTARESFGAGSGVVIERDDDRSAEKPGETGDAADDGREDALVVDVSGAVAAPAVVELAAGARVQDAIEAAGGLAPDADTSSLNRAAQLTDGQKVHVPRRGEVELSADGTSANGGTGPSASSPLVNINTADAATLDELPGVGPSTAQAIIDDREANGAFASIEDLMRVSGIGEKKFEKLKSAICI